MQEKKTSENMRVSRERNGLVIEWIPENSEKVWAWKVVNL